MCCLGQTIGVKAPYRLKGLVGAVLAGALTACEAPRDAPSQIDAPLIEAPAEAPQIADSAPLPLSELPEAVVETRAQLLSIAENGTLWDMARLARRTPGFISNSGGVAHKDFWYMGYRTGDWPTVQLGRTLQTEPSRVQTPDGEVFVWPYFAVLEPGELTAAAEQDVRTHSGDWQADEMRAGGPFTGYRLGIREDGVWLYFASR